MKYLNREIQHPHLDKRVTKSHVLVEATSSCPEQSFLLLFSAEAINLDPVTGAEGADSTLHRWVTGHEQALWPIRADVTNTEVPGCHS